MTEQASHELHIDGLPKDFRTEGAWFMRDVLAVRTQESMDTPSVQPWPVANASEYTHAPQKEMRYIVEGPMPNGKRHPEMSAGMSRVFRAWDVKLQQTVFLKLIDTSMYPTEGERKQYVDSLEREAKMLARVEGSAKVYDFFFTSDYPDDYRVASRNRDPVPVIVMEYIPPEVARPLNVLMDEKKKAGQSMDLAASFFIIEEVARILDTNNKKMLQMQGEEPKEDEFDKRKQLVNRDIKPNNIMVGNNFVRVLDYGLTQDVFKYPDESSLEEPDEGVLGTPKYISPEQAVGAKQIDSRADIYSLGVIALELFSGKNYHERFQSGSDVRNGFDMSEAVIMFLNAINGTNSHRINIYLEDRFEDATLRARITEVFTKALSKDVKKRYKTGTEFVTALKQCFQVPVERS